MQKIILVPNLHLPNKTFIEWGQNLASIGPQVIVFDQKPENILENSWQDLLENVRQFHNNYYERGKELYYITEGRGFIPVLNAVESSKISGIYSLQPIIKQSKNYKKRLAQNLNEKYLLEETRSAIHLFLPERGFENDFPKTIKYLKKLAKPNILVNTYDVPSLLTDSCLEEIRGYILYNLGIKV